MSLLDAYRKRVSIDGSSHSEAFSNSTRTLINDSFEDSPTFSKIMIGKDQYDVRITDERKIDEKKLLFRPDTDTIQIGEYAIISDNKWLLLNFDPDRITPKSIIKKADRTLRWKDNLGNILEEPCVIESVLYEEMRDGIYFYSPKGNLKIFTQYNQNTKKILNQMRFLFGTDAYSIGGIDNFSNVYDDKGYLVINLEKSKILPKDDFTTGIADNYEVYANNNPQGSNTGGGWLK